MVNMLKKKYVQRRGGSGYKKVKRKKTVHFVGHLLVEAKTQGLAIVDNA
jgi:hypothetical protein